MAKSGEDVMKKALILLPLLLAACQPSDTSVHGYVEGEFVLIAPTTSGLLDHMTVSRGQEVHVMDELFSLDVTELSAQQISASANVRQAEAALSDLLKGDRPEEIEVILMQKEQAKARLVNARKEYDRFLSLRKSGSLSVASLDNARAELDSATARRDELEALLKTASLGARIDKIEGAKASLERAKQALVEADKRLKDAAPNARLDARVENTFFQAGEFVAAGQPVVKLLSLEDIKVRFFVSQQTVAKLKPDQAVMISCDGCAQPIAGKITYIASTSEYTPPVIYSVDSREKLVFLVEAKPDEVQTALRPGLPVDIDLGL
jgi:HlyD family secretion protein